MRNFAKKLFAAGLAASTALTSFGSLALVAKASPHGAGSIVAAAGDPTIYFIDGQGSRRPFTSGGALLSYGFLSFSQVQQANSDDLALPVGAFIPPQDGKLITSDRGADKGTTYLITDGKKAGFTSAAVFTGLGFNFSRGTVGDVSWMTSAANIDNTTSAHRPGVLVNNGGTIQLINMTGLCGIPDVATFNSWGFSFNDVVPSNAADRTMTQAAVMNTRVPGQLSPTCSNTTPPTPGSVTVSAASNNPAAATVPRGSTNVPFMRFTMANTSSNDVVVTGVTLNRTGAGQSSDFDNVYLYNGDSRLTSGRSINSSTNQAAFNGLNITIPANGSVTLSALADISASAGAGNVNFLSVANATLASGTVTGSASGNAMTIATATAGSVTIQANGGTLTNPKVGQTNFKIGQFQITAGAQEDLTIKRISLFNGGSINRSYLTNFKLRQAGTDVASASSVDSKDHVNFTLDFNLDKGNNRTFEVYADISGAAKPGDTIKLYLEENTDLFVMGRVYGFGAQVTRTLYDNSPSDSSNASLTTIDGGKMTVSFTGPAASDIAKDGRDVEVFRFTIAAQNNIEVRQLKLTVDGGTGVADLTTAGQPNYTDIKVTDTSNNTVVWGPQDLSGAGSDTTQNLTFPEDVTINSGTTKTYAVTTDIANLADVTDGDKLRIVLDMTGFSSQVKNLDNNTFLAANEIVPTANLNGNTHTVRVSGLDVTLAGTPTPASFVKGSQAVPTVGLNFRAGTAKDVRITSITLTGIIDSDNNGTGAVGVEGGVNFSDDVISVELYDGTTKVGNTESPTVSTGLVQFTNLNFTVPKGTTKTLVAKVNTNSSLTAPDKIKLGIAASGVTANDQDGNSITPTGLPVNQILTMGTGTSITLVDTGTLTVANAPTEVDVTDSHIVIAGSSDVTMAKYRFTASNEELRVDKLRVSIPSNRIQDVSSLRLYDGATAVSASAVPDGTGLVYFESITGFVVPKDGSKTLTVKANLNAITGTSGAVSGDDIQVTLEGQNADGFEARGTGASNTFITSLSNADYAATGSMVLRKTKPTVTLVNLPSTVLTTGTQTVMKFTVAADAGEQVSLKELNIALTASNATFTANTIRIRQSGSGVNLPTSVNTNGAGTGNGKLVFTSEENIPAGTTKTYEIRLDIATVTAPASVSARINETSTNIETGALATDGAAGAQVGGADDLFVWSDNSGVPHDSAIPSTSTDWTNGYLVRVVPSDSQTMSLTN